VAKAPADRYPSCGAFAEALREALVDGAAGVPPTPDTRVPTPPTVSSAAPAAPALKPAKARSVLSTSTPRRLVVAGGLAAALVIMLVLALVSGWPFGSGDSSATATPLSGLVNTLAVDPEGGLYVATLVDPRVLKVEPSGTLRVIAGTGTKGYSGDGGPADKAQ